MEVIEVTEREIEVIEVIERGPQGPQGAGITTLTTQGDLLYRGATTGERLPIGTTGQILKVSSGGIPEWGAAPSSGVSSVSGTSPIVSSGGATPAISITAATTSAAGSMSAADKTKLDGIASGAEVNVNADWNASSGDAQILNKPTIPSTAADVGAVPTSRTISAGTGLTGGGDLSANRTLAVNYGTTAGTACEGNDGRIAYIASGKIDQRISGFGSIGTINMTANDGISGSINTSDGGGDAGGGSINTSGHISGSLGGSINTSAGVDLNGGSLDLSQGGGSINTRGTGSIELGNAGTRTTLTGTATADRAISLPNAAGTLALTSDITKTAVGLGNVTNNAQTQASIVPNTAPSAGQLLVGNAGGTAYAPAALSGDATIASTGALTLANTSTARTNIGLGNVANVDTTNAANISSGVLPNARVNWAAPSAIGSTTASSVAATTLSATSLTLGTSGILSGGTNTIEQRNTTSAQTYRIYNTVSGAADANHERLFLRWSSNVAQIGTEKAGTGSARALEFQTDGTTRLTISAGGSVTVAGTLIGGPIQSNSHVRVAAISQLEFGSGGSRISNQSSGVLTLHDSALSDFNRLQFGGTTNLFPALKRSSTALQVRLADDSADAPLSASLFSVGSGSFDGVIGRPNAGVIGFARADGATTYIAALGFDGTTRAFVANSGAFIGWSSGNATSVASGDTRLWRDAAGVIAQYNGVNAQTYRLYNTFTSSTNFERLNVRWATNECIIDAEAGSGGGTLRGIKLGSATSSLLGFYGATPVAQRAAIADATDAATTQARLNDLLAAMRSLGLIAT